MSVCVCVCVYTDVCHVMFVCVCVVSLGPSDGFMWRWCDNGVLCDASPSIGPIATFTEVWGQVAWSSHVCS